ARRGGRGGGMLLQFLPKAPERARQADLHPGDAPEGTVAHTVAEDDAWVEGQSLIGTVEDVDLIDPDLSGERLLYRLFHERGVRVFSPLPLRARCSCSREAVSAMFKSFAPQDRADMVKDGKVVVTCEFCSSVYEFTPQEAGVEEALVEAPRSLAALLCAGDAPDRIANIVRHQEGAVGPERYADRASIGGPFVRRKKPAQNIPRR